MKGHILSQLQPLFFNFRRIFFQVREIEGSEEIEESLISADLLDAAICMNHDFLVPETAIVIVSHAVAVGAGVMDNDEIARLNFRQGTLDSKFIAVFAEGSALPRTVR